jgi:hypothetical protein
MSTVLNARTGETLNTFYAAAYAESVARQHRPYARAYLAWRLGQSDAEPPLAGGLSEPGAKVIRFGIDEKVRMNGTHGAPPPGAFAPWYK